MTERIARLRKVSRPWNLGADWVKEVPFSVRFPTILKYPMRKISAVLAHWQMLCNFSVGKGGNTGYGR
jgi:hypothetical protein